MVGVVGVEQDRPVVEPVHSMERVGEEEALCPSDGPTATCKNLGPREEDGCFDRLRLNDSGIR